VKYLKNKTLKKNVSCKSCRVLKNALNEYLFDLECEGALKINFKILNKNLHFLFNIFITDIKIFSKCYNETSFGYALFEI